MDYRKTNNNSYNIHTIKTDKFKTVRMEIVFSNKVNREEMPIYTFLCDLLTDTSKHYQTRKDINIKLEELYKTVFYGVTNKVGNLFMVTFVIEFIAPKYINDDNYLNNVISFIFDVLNNPNVKSSEFDINNFNVVKRRILQEIESLKENPSRYSLKQALNKMDENSVSSHSVLGTKEDIENITPSNLYEAYQNLFKNYLCDIFVIGDFNREELIDLVRNKFKNRVIKSKKIDLLVENKLRKKPISTIEKSSFVQSTLVMIYNIKNLDKKLKNIDFHVFNYILGGGLPSLLYKKLRSDNSLCYSLKSLYLKYDELLVVQVSLDKENVKLAKSLIDKCIKEVVSGKFSDELINDTKKNLTFSLKIGLDNNVSVLNNYEFNIFDGLPLVEERIKLINEVKKEDIIKCAKSLTLNTIYVLDSENENERD